MKMAIKIASIRLDTRLTVEAIHVLNVNSRSEAVHTALREVVAMEKFKAVMKNMAEN